MQLVESSVRYGKLEKATVDPLAAAVPSTCAVNYRQTNRDASPLLSKSS